METTHEHMGEKFKSESSSGSFEVLPKDYNNWSSTLVVFKEKDEEIAVYAFNCEDCVIYHVVSFSRPKWLIRKLGYTAGNGKLYFVGIVEEQDDKLINSLAVEVYDVCRKEWTTGEFPKLQAPKPKPFVFFLDSHLCVLSSAVSCDPNQTHFEMVDVNNCHRGWRFVPEPTFVWKDIWACHHHSIIDYTKNTLYIRLLDDCTGTLYVYNFQDKQWRTHGKLLTPRDGHMLKASWCNGSTIVESFLFNFRMWRYPEGLRAMLIVRDLNHPLEASDETLEYVDVDDLHFDIDPLVEGVARINISHVVDPSLLDDLYSASFLVYVGKINSCLRFSLVVSHNYRSCVHVSACTFDLAINSRNLNQSTVARVCCSPSPSARQLIDVGSRRGPLACYKLY